MPQGALPAPLTSINGLTPSGSALNITAPAVVKATKGYVLKVAVIVAGSTVGTVNDITTTGAAAVANQVFAIPNTVGIYSLDFLCLTGIVVVPGTGMTVTVAYA